MAKLGRGPILFAILLLRFTFAVGLECEDLSIEDCAFAVSSTGARCVLEKSTLQNGETSAECQTSIIMAEKPLEWIETDECIKSCGLERVSYGLSTDALMEKGFTAKLCSAECQNNCPNIVDLYIKLAAGEGVYLPRLCTSQKSRSRRLIADPVQALKAVAGSDPQIVVTSDTWKQSEVAPGPLEAAAYSPTSLPQSNLEESALTPAQSPESDIAYLPISRSAAEVYPTAGPTALPSVANAATSTTVAVSVAHTSAEDLENEYHQ
ncbi:hypothetical protein MPTK1_5g11780 [Marchantia polymorpha subsp. ruderalis]|uniref:PAR1 protein n=2 Tax=Marchantia polymorpha TaxID=3197 RepID=A0A176VFA1_MARPO|nr:hypothetical protein AXG93_163s1060 [Marchantia polymorpha subsp. ruderalis]PTQ29323.1 hypothetical protein MARPO_0143s0006 [Marchantia polymorpha]PTQ29324.1 hypothetical protein MARPO_0143s0006 [Marchantia polymorpha]BBN11425.1 hypothetical protein Mp_5g11780 [Marchantia polymorpha subsp. ruderalis]BBN11426.1 hypothetical protein Mp_5g11780 [Marchantia polymorpha subsp. ruderalis]|eukprot:PTQ29323.1 hypothetical protein MARPO_0143s0006 [Marchantia polymorpha]